MTFRALGDNVEAAMFLGAPEELARPEVEYTVLEYYNAETGGADETWLLRDGDAYFLLRTVRDISQYVNEWDEWIGPEPGDDGHNDID